MIYTISKGYYCLAKTAVFICSLDRHSLGVQKDKGVINPWNNKKKYMTSSSSELAPAA